MLKLHNVDFHMDVKPIINKFLISKGITTFSMKGIHFGNCCLVNIPNNMIDDIQAIPGVQFRNTKTLLEKEDLLNYRIGEKITIEHLETDFFPVKNKKGTVYKIKENELTIRAYKKQNKGWRIDIGDNVQIKKGW